MIGCVRSLSPLREERNMERGRIRFNFRSANIAHFSGRGRSIACAGSGKAVASSHSVRAS